MIYVVFIGLILIFLIALGIKWEIRLSIVIPWACLMASLGSLSLYYLGKTFPNLPVVTQLIICLAQSIIITGIMILIMFYRDPNRIPPNKDRIILSPADGRIIYIKQINNGDFPFAIKGKKRIDLKEFTNEEFITDRGIQIGILMTYINIHVNRSPIKGRINRIIKIPGHFLSLKNISSILENERVFTIIDGNEINIGIVQIASRLVRRIYSYVKEGENVQIGQRIGIIKFGSQVDILIPYLDTINILVKPNEEVKAGTTIIATY